MLTAPILAKSMAVAVMLFALGSLTYAFRHDASDNFERWMVVGVCLILLGIATCLLLGCFRRRVELTPKGIISTNAFGRQKSIRWKDVRRVSFNALEVGFRLQTAEGVVILVDTWLGGQRDFARKTLKRVSAERIECEGQLITIADRRRKPRRTHAR